MCNALMEMGNHFFFWGAKLVLGSAVLAILAKILTGMAM